MLLQQESGGYARGTIVRLNGSFKYTTSGNVVDTIRDGNSKAVASVTRISAGLYEVTLGDTYPLPERLITARAWVNQTATVGRVMVGEVVESGTGAYSQTTRKFRIVLKLVGDVALSAYTDPSQSDPDDQARICFELVGSTSSIGTDPA